MYSDPMTVTELSAWLEGVLPADVAFGVGPIADHTGALQPEEAAAIAKAVDVRRFEYSTGRHYATVAAERLGISLGSLATRSDRQPDWPWVVTGSISHSRGLCVAILARHATVPAIGVDIERVADVGAELMQLVSTPSEMTANSGTVPEAALPACLFSIREAIYKAYYPATGAQLGFRDVGLALDGQTGRFKAKLTNERLPPFFGRRDIVGRFALIRGFVVSLACAEVECDVLMRGK
jgi:4'-phosphopantetheinyl transferase EntD